MTSVNATNLYNRVSHLEHASGATERRIDFAVQETHDMILAIYRRLDAIESAIGISHTLQEYVPCDECPE